MADEEKKPATTTKLATRGGLFAAKKTGLAANLEKAATAYDPSKMEHRLGLVFDDSGSMNGEPIQKAKEATKEFIKSCNPSQTAITLYHFGDNNLVLTTDLISVGFYADGLTASYSTPLWATLDKLIVNENISRAIVFSDGDATDGKVFLYGSNEGKVKNDKVEKILAQYKDKKISVDTVFLGADAQYLHEENGAIWTLKYIAEQTGGIFLHFKDAGTFAKNFKYLTPGFRGLLSDGNFKAAIEKG